MPFSKALVRFLWIRPRYLNIFPVLNVFNREVDAVYKQIKGEPNMQLFKTRNNMKSFTLVKASRIKSFATHTICNNTKRFVLLAFHPSSLHIVTIIIFLLLLSSTYIAQFLSSLALFCGMKCGGWKINIECCF